MLKELIKKILAGKTSVNRIGSARVALGADPSGVVVALETAALAEEFARSAKELRRKGEVEAAIQGFCRSVVLEEFVGNLWGISSDLGNVAEIYRDLKKYDIAEEIYVWLRELDEHLINEPAQVGDLRKLETPDEQMQDYRLLFGLHSEGLAMVYVATGRYPLAMKLIPEIERSYETAGRKDDLSRVHDLRTWLQRASKTS